MVNIQVDLSRITYQDRVNMYTLMDVSTRENGKITKSTESGSTIWTVELFTKEDSLMERETAEEPLLGKKIKFIN
jgi:hypothetical protein